MDTKKIDRAKAEALEVIRAEYGREPRDLRPMLADRAGIWFSFTMDRWENTSQICAQNVLDSEDYKEIEERGGYIVIPRNYR